MDHLRRGGNYNRFQRYAHGPIGSSQMRGVLSPASILRTDLTRLIEPSFFIYVPPIETNLFRTRIISAFPSPRTCLNPVIAAP